METQLTKDELNDLAELACSHADHFDYDEQYSQKYIDLYEKLLKMLEVVKPTSK